MTVFALVAVALSFASVQPASAWTWEKDGQECNPDAGDNIEQLPPPQAMLMLDRSGSMGSDIPIGNSCNRCSYDYTENNVNQCTFSGGEYCEEDCAINFFGGWFCSDDWKPLNSTTVECSNCGSDGQCQNNKDSLLDGTVTDDYCGSRNNNSSHSTTSKSRSGSFECAECETDSACRDALEQRISGDYTINSVNHYWDGGWLDLNCNSVSKSKWEIAKDSIDAVTKDMTASNPDEVEFGLGLFYNDYAGIEREAGPNANPGIMADLNADDPVSWHGTPMASGVDAMHKSNTVQNAAGGSAGVLITDGMPSGSHSDVVREACQHSNDAPMYVVGFGDGADPDYNDVLAAAGGTGSCTSGDPCTNPGDYGNHQGNCEGSIQVDNEAALKSALSKIANEISCTFDLDDVTNNSGTEPWNDPDQGCDDDYDCLKIELGGSQRIYHVDSNQSPTGWQFSSGNSIRVLNKSDGADKNYCDMIRDGHVNNPSGNDVSIELACMCQRQPGSACQASDMSPPPRTCECPIGDWSCQEGLDICQPRSNCGQRVGEGDSCSVGTGACERDGETVCNASGNVTCDADPGNPREEVCNGIDDDCDGQVDEGIGWDGDDLCHVDHGRDEDAIAAETNRCKLGIARCGGDGAESCEPFEPLPEVCNGIDDDCDGQVDNLSDGWDEYNDDHDTSHSLPDRYEGATCNERDVCSCPDGRGSVTRSDGFSDHMETWANGENPPDPDCNCGQSLSP
ncbi:MAG: vWA domain-containing protein [Persicimonas sp.]